MNGKGSKRRPSKRGAYERGYQAIDWSKGRPSPAQRKMTPMECLEQNYARLSRELGFADSNPPRQGKCCGHERCDNDATEEHTCPFAEEINGSDRLCTCCADCTHQCAMDI